MGTWFFLWFLLLPAVHAAPERRSSVTHEDIRDALLSVVHMLQTTTQKLERHEMRERQLGDQVKKALGGLDSRERAQDSAIAGIVATLNRLDSKLEALQGQINQQEERQKGSYTVDTVPLQSWMSNVEGMLNKQSPGAGSGLSNEQLEKIELAVSSKVDMLISAVKRLEIMTQPNSALGDYKSEMALQLTVQEKWHQNVMEGLEEIRKISSEMLNNSPTADNFTKIELAKIRYDLDYLSGDRLMNLDVKLQQILGDANQLPSISSNIKDLKESMDGYFTDVRNSQDELVTGIKSLSKVEQVLIQTADNVLDTRRRVEFGVQEVLLGIGELVKTESKELNNTVNSRFNDISQTIMENQNFGLSNLSSKIEMEISQVWRQIGIMYQQLTESTSALGKLQKQTELYVNGSLSTMDNMDGRVEEITGRVSDVKDNLNYLMGRLMLVTQEFNQTKGDLATAFENLRNTFKSVRKDAKDLGPGPNPIDELEDNKV